MINKEEIEKNRMNAIKEMVENDQYFDRIVTIHVMLGSIISNAKMVAFGEDGPQESDVEMCSDGTERYTDQGYEKLSCVAMDHIISYYVDIDNTLDEVKKLRSSIKKE